MIVMSLALVGLIGPVPPCFLGPGPVPCQDGRFCKARKRSLALSASCHDEASPVVHVVDCHGDALQHWEALPGEGYGVLHLDSHADMFLDFEPAPSPPEASTRQELHKTLSSQVHLSNFMPLGILGGKVSNVVWLRSDFPDCRYNGPPPGTYLMEIGAPALDFPSGPALCYWQRGGESFRDYSFMADALDGGYQVIGERDGWPPRERNLWWEKVPYMLDEFGLHLLGEPMGNAYTVPVAGLHRAFNFSVMTDVQWHADETSAAAFLKQQLRPQHWILDVDLDFFATLAPALAPAVRRLGLARSQSNRLGQTAQALAVVVEAIESQDPNCQAFRLPLLDETIHRLLALGTHVQSNDVTACLKEVDARTDVASDHAEYIANVLRGLSDDDREVWMRMAPEELDAAVESPHGPHFAASPEAIKEAMADLERLLGSLVKRHGLPPPSVVTVARSTDLYLPLDIGPLVEAQLLATLDRLGWAAKSAEPAPRWPAGAMVESLMG